MESARNIDGNGFLLVKGCPISSFGIFDYSAAQLGLDGDPNRIVKVFRPESAVSDPEAIESFKNVPFLIDHEMLSGFEDDDEVMAPEEKGMDGVLTGNVYYEAPWMRGDLKIYTRRAQAALAKNKKDLSLGYSCDFEVKPGVWNGQSYEVVQTNLRGNHIALVDEGRVPGARVLDGLIFDHLNFEVVRPSDKGNSTMKNTNNAKRRTAKDNAVEQLQALLPALQEFLQQEANEPEHNPDPNAPADPAPVPATPQDNGDPDAAAAAAAAADPEGATNPDASAGPDDIKALIQKVQEILAQLSAVAGGGGSGNEGAGNGEGSGEDENGNANENGEGTNAADEGAGEGSAEERNGKASPGPGAGKNAMAGDAAVRMFYSDLATKDRLYNRLSKVVGTFDHKAMDSRAVAVYGVNKIPALKGKVAKGNEAIALDMYLTGREEAARHTTPKTNAADSSHQAVSADLDAYLNGSK